MAKFMKIILFDKKCKPKYSNVNDAGMDVFAREDTSWYLKDGLWRCDISLGFALKCPQEYGIFLLSRSGMGKHESISLVNSVGLGDRSFGENEYAAMLIKQSVGIKQPKDIKQYEKIAQLVIIETPKIYLDEVTTFHIKESKKGFGSSGNK